jgi:CxxC motif-containing protein (DUF1111 family)
VSRSPQPRRRPHPRTEGEVARRAAASALAASVLAAVSAVAMSTSPLTPAALPLAGELVKGQPFKNHRDPPPYRKLSDAEAARYDLGMRVFNTQFMVAGTAGAGRRDGVGPLFNAASCDQCHNNGAHGRGPVGDGPAPVALVIQLATPSARS